MLHVYWDSFTGFFLEVDLFILFIWRRIWLHCIFFVSKDWLRVFLTYLYLQRLTTVICNIGLFCSKASCHCNSNTNGGYIFKKTKLGKVSYLIVMILINELHGKWIVNGDGCIAFGRE